MKIASSFAFFGLLLSTAIWGSSFFIIKDTLTTIHPVNLVAYRFGIAALLFACIVLVRGEKLWAHAKHGFILGFSVWIIYRFCSNLWFTFFQNETEIDATSWPSVRTVWTVAVDWWFTKH